MDHVTLLLLQRLQVGGDSEYRDVNAPAEAGLFVTDDRLVVYAQASSQEGLPRRLRTDSELGSNLEFFIRKGKRMVTPEEEPTAALEIAPEDILLKGTYGRKPGNERMVVKADYKYKVLARRRMTRAEYEHGKATGFKGGPIKELTSRLGADPRERKVERVDVEVIEPEPRNYQDKGNYQRPAEKTGLLQRLYKIARKPLAIGALVLAATAGVVAYKVQEGRERDRFGILSPDEESKLK
ncbi:unnamed protein product, partial [marine sediment metagenome]